MYAPMGRAKLSSERARPARRAKGQDERDPEAPAGPQVTCTPAGPLPESAAELNGTEIDSDSDSPPGNRCDLELEAPTTPWLVLTTARQVARPVWLDSLATMKVTFARGIVVADCSTGWNRTALTAYDGAGGPTARMATQVPIDPSTTITAVTRATARTMRERR
jgi:hypothetical protein